MTPLQFAQRTVQTRQVIALPSRTLPKPLTLVKINQKHL